MLKVKSLIAILPALLFSFSCKKRDVQTHNGNTTNEQHISVLTQHNNNTRAGLNNQETRLNINNVNARQFQKLFTLSVDDQVYAQPLVYGDLNIGGGLRNVVLVATVNNSVYAFDGDNGKLYWSENYTLAGMRPPKNTDMTGACGGNFKDFSGNMGIVGTPVIDSATHTIYFVSKSTDGSTYIQQLHAVNIVTGNEQPGSPVKIVVNYPGTGDGSINNVIGFDPQKANQRPALTLLNGVVYIGFSGYCGWGPYHGWLLGYNSKTLQLQTAYNDTPTGGDGGIWESGMGAAADTNGNLYIVTGNGSVGDNGDPTNLINRGESALKLSPNGNTLKVNSYFTPYSYQLLNDHDLDMGCMGAFLIPNSNYLISGCKNGNIYLLNKDNMGGYSAGSDQVQQIITLGSQSYNHSLPAYFKGTANEFIYVWPENDKLHAFPFNRGNNTLNVGQDVIGPTGPTGYTGTMLSVSSNGPTTGSGIVWASYAATGNANQQVQPGILRAFDANNVTKELWNNSQDPAVNFAKFCPPTIANGHVYLGTFSNQVVVYGLK